MLIPISGTLYYRREKGVKGVARFSIVRAGTTLCEAVLWMPWLHRGTMRALIETELVELKSQKFREVTLAHPDIAWHAKKQALAFIEELQSDTGLYGCVWDIPTRLMYIDPTTEPAACADTVEIMEVRQSEVEAARLMDSSSSEDEDQQPPYPSSCYGGSASSAGSVSQVTFDSEMTSR